MGTQAGAARGDRLSLRIGRESDGWNARSSSGQTPWVRVKALHFAATPLRKATPVRAAALASPYTLPSATSRRSASPSCGATSGSLLRGENFQRIAVVGSVYLGHLGIRHATKDASTRASAGMPPAIADLMRPPVLCLGRSSPGLHSASQSQKSCRTTPPAWSARRNTCQSRSASLDIRYLPCLLIWHSKSLLHGRSCHRRGPGLIEKRQERRSSCPRPPGSAPRLG
jgi:hypothetical protein